MQKSRKKGKSRSLSLTQGVLMQRTALQDKSFSTAVLGRQVISFMHSVIFSLLSFLLFNSKPGAISYADVWHPKEP